MTLRKRVWGGPMSLRKISQASFAGGPVMLRKGGPMTLRKTAFAGPLSLRTGTREPETEPRSLNARPARRDCGTFGEHHRKFGDRRVRHLAHQLHEHVRDRTVNRRRVSSTTRSGLERVRLSLQPEDPVHARVAKAEQLRGLRVRASFFASLKHGGAHLQRNGHRLSPKIVPTRSGRAVSVFVGRPSSWRARGGPLVRETGAMASRASRLRRAITSSARGAWRVPACSRRAAQLNIAERVRSGRDMGFVLATSFARAWAMRARERQRRGGAPARPARRRPPRDHVRTAVRSEQPSGR